MEVKSDAPDKRFVVSDDEDIYRLISYPGCIDDQLELSPEIFSLYHQNEDYVSVDRAIYTTIEDVKKHGGIIKRWPYKKDVFWGAVRLNVGKTRAVSERVCVDSHYEEWYKAHAGISYLLDDGSKLKHTGDEIIPAWLLGIQLRLCEIVDEIIRK